MSTSLHDKITESVRQAIAGGVSPELMAMQIVASLADAGPVDRAWAEVCAAAADLGAALAVFDNAMRAYGRARRGQT